MASSTHAVRIAFHAGRGHGHQQDDPWRYSIGFEASIEHVEGTGRSVGFAIGLFPRPEREGPTPWWRQIEVLWWPR